MNEIIKQEAVLKYDFEGAKKKIAERLEQFQGAVFTEESKPLAKKVVAELRKEQKAFSDRVREVKKAYMTPFDNFKKQADELVCLYDEPIDFINGQVQTYEEQRKIAKQAEIECVYNNVFLEKEIAPLEKIFNPKWLNATYKIIVIEKDINDLSERVTNDIKMIRDMQSPDETQAISVYKANLNVADAIRLINERAKIREDAVKRQAEEAERKQQEEIRRQEREKLLAEQETERRLQQAEVEKQQAIEQAQADVMEVLTPEQGGETEAYDYAIFLTEAEKETLETYMNSVGIEFLCKGVL